MLGRVDVSRYVNGALKLRNFTPLAQGGVERRSGTRFRGAARGAGRLQEFIFSVKQAYVLEFTHGKIRFYRDGAQIKNLDTSVYEIFTPYTLEDVDQLYFAQSADVLYIQHPKYQTRTLIRRGDTDWTLGLYETRDGPYLGKVVDGVEMRISNVVDTAELKSDVDVFEAGTTPAGDVGEFVQFQEDDQWRLGKITQWINKRHVVIQYMTNIMLGAEQADLVAAKAPVSVPYGRVSPVNKLTFTTPNVLASNSATVFTSNDVGKVVRVYETTPTAWTNETSSGTSGYLWYLLKIFNTTSSMASAVITPYKDYNVSQVRLTMSNRKTTATLTASQSTFVATDVNRQFRLNYNSAITWGKITGYTSPTVVSVELKESMPLDQDQRDNSSDPTVVQLSNNGATFDWKLGAWSETTGWPACATFHQSRLWFARTDTEPQSLWATQPEDYDNMATTDVDSAVLDTSAISITLASNQANEIVWLSSGKVLLVGTISSEWQIKPDSNIGDAISPKNIRASSDTDYGSRTSTRALRTGSSTLFLQPSGSKVRDLYYDFGTDSFVARDLTVVAEHILRDGGGAKQIMYQKEPNSMVWAVRNDGKLAALTLEKDQEVYAWHLHELGGTNAKVISAAVVPDPTTQASILYLLVCRTIAGVTSYFVESLDPSFDGLKSSIFFVDAGLSYTGDPVTAVGGLDHLNGEEVDVVADGVHIGKQTVASGQVQLDDPAREVHAGLPFTSILTLLPPVTQTRIGTGIARVQRPCEVGVRVHQSMELLYGPSESDLSVFSFKDSDTPMNDSAALFSGIKVFNANHDPDREGLITFSQERPYPLTILSVVVSTAVSERV